MLVEGARMADVSKVRQPQHPSHEKCSVGERLYSRVHVCNHARCAANDPDYNVKSAVPLKKFLVAKKHAYGGLEEKGEKRRVSTVSSTTTPDHPRDRRSHALKSLTDSVLTTESGSNGKVRSDGLRSNAHSVGQSRRATRDNSCISSETRKVLERKPRPTAAHSSSSVPSSARRRSVAAIESYSPAQKSRLSSAGSIFSTQATERSKPCESASPESSVTSIRITQFFSTRREEAENGEDETRQHVHSAGAASSPRASVGSNQDTEISSSKENVGDFEQSTPNSGDLKSPASSSSNILQENSANRDLTFDSLSPSSPSVDSTPRVLESLTPSAPSTSFASTTAETTSLTTTPSSEISSSILSKAAVGQEESNYVSSGPSVDSGPPTTSGSLTSSGTSLKSGPPRSPGSTRRPSRTTTPSSSSDKLRGSFTTSLKESSKAGSPSSSSSRASASRPSRIPRNPVVPAPVDSSPAPTNPSKLAKKFITDVQARSVSRRSTKGVRSIELRGGKAQSYSTTTVTSWNMTTTTVETSLSISEITTEKIVESGLSGSGLSEASAKPEQLSKKESQTAAAGPNASATDPKAVKEAPTIGKFVKNARSFEEVHADAETVSLKHGEVAERRLSEEYMTNHALEGVVRKISENDHRVKVLVHAFETLATLDSEILPIDATTLGHDLGHESLSGTTIAV